MAVDDAHGIPKQDGGFVVVFAPKLTQSSMIAALRQGNFYTSQGPDISVTVTGATIKVATRATSRIEFITNGGIRQTNENVTSGSYTAVEDDLYVRARVIRGYDGKIAWSQPAWREVAQAVETAANQPLP